MQLPLLCRTACGVAVRLAGLPLSPVSTVAGSGEQGMVSPTPHGPDTLGGPLSYLSLAQRAKIEVRPSAPCRSFCSVLKHGGR